MVDITHKSVTLREATAQALITAGSALTIERVQKGDVPKGNVLEIARAAGLLGLKNTFQVIPDCHPLPIEFAQISYEFQERSIQVRVQVRTIYKTGVEVEAMYGASVVAITLYDMLKPIDDHLEISQIKLLEKKGGKTSFSKPAAGLRARVVVCSDSVSQGTQVDRSGRVIQEKLEALGLTVTYTVIPDEGADITREAQHPDTDLVIFTGGTGVGPRDVTPDTLLPLLDVRLHGVEEQMRRYGQERMPYAMLSRSVAGLKDGRLLLALPGSAKGAAECMEAIFPHVLHVFAVVGGARHEG